MTSRLTLDLLPLSSVSGLGKPPLRGAGETVPSAIRGLLTADLPKVDRPLGHDLSPDLYVPDHYEPRYAYPLILWLRSDGATPDRAAQGEFRRLMRRISDRNCFGAAIPTSPVESLEARIVETVGVLRRQYHLHSERIYLAACGNDAERALQVGMARPEWFGGVIALSPAVSTRHRWLARFNALRGKRVLLAAGSEDQSQVEAIRKLRRLLWSAGVSVRACQHESADPLDNGLCREIDRWLIQAIEESSAAA